MRVTILSPAQAAEYRERRMAWIRQQLRLEALRREGLRRDVDLAVGRWRASPITWLRAVWSYWFRP